MTNRNSIPQDPNGAWYTSGIRIGTPALTTRGLGTAEMDVIAGLIHEVLSRPRPGKTSSGGPSKVTYELDPALATGSASRPPICWPVSRSTPPWTWADALPGRPQARGPAGLPCMIREAWEDNRKVTNPAINACAPIRPRPSGDPAPRS